MPNSWKWRDANIAIHVAADGAENGRSHSMNPLARNPPLRLSPPGMTDDRPFVPWALPS